jgi:hypothetical protein
VLHRGADQGAQALKRLCQCQTRQIG